MLSENQTRNSNYHPVIARISMLLMLGPLAFTLLFAQSNLKPGLLVTKANDTIHGFIDYRNWANNPEKVEFYRSMGDKATVYFPKDIQCFSVSGETYLSAVVTIDNSPFKTENLKEESDFNYITDTVFLLNLINGEKSLYYYKDIKDKEHFFIMNNSAIELLLYKCYLKRDIVGNLSIFQNKKYVGQLSIYLKDCSTIQGRMANLKYNRMNLVKLFLYYYSCSKKKMVSQNKAFSKPYEFGVLAGLSLTKLKFFTGMDYFLKAQYPLSKNVSAGLFYNIVFPRNFGQMSINNELLYYSYKTQSFYNKAVTTGIGLHYLMLNMLVRFKYPLYKAGIFLKSGLSIGYGFNETNYQRFEATALQRASEAKALSKIDKVNFGVNLGIGIKFQKYTFESRYMYGFNNDNILLSMDNNRSKTNTVFLLLGYQF
jgi:hypothetical protein